MYELFRRHGTSYSCLLQILRLQLGSPNSLSWLNYCVLMSAVNFHLSCMYSFILFKQNSAWALLASCCWIADRYNTALVCHRWCFLACHPRLWLRVERPIKDLAEPGVFPSLETAISAARLVVISCLIAKKRNGEWQRILFMFGQRPGDTILIAAGGNHVASNIQIEKPLCLVSQNIHYKCFFLLASAI